MSSAREQMNSHGHLGDRDREREGSKKVDNIGKTPPCRPDRTMKLSKNSKILSMDQY